MLHTAAAGTATLTVSGHPHLLRRLRYVDEMYDGTVSVSSDQATPTYCGDYAIPTEPARSVSATNNVTNNDRGR